MRCFIGIDVPENIKTYLFEKIQALKCMNNHALYGMSITKKENIHVTLAFLGELDEKGAEKAIKTAFGIAKKIKPFECRLLNIMAVPKKHPRMIWALLDTNPELHMLYEALNRALTNEKIMAKGEEHNEFKAHITLARLKAAGTEKIKGFAGEIKIDPRAFMVHEIKIMQSMLKKEGPEYVAIKSISLSS